MRRLMLLRHAKAERSRPGQSDLERRLTDRGHQDAPTVGAYLVRHGLTPDAAVVSPAARTRETWDLVAKTLGRPPAPTFDDRLYDAEPEDILSVIKDTGAGTKALLVLGHNPGLHELAALLTGSGDPDARQRLSEGLPTSGLVAIEFAAETWERLDPQSGRLERFVTPRPSGAAAD